MAQKVIGLDLGSSSIKAVVVRMGLRGAEILKCDKEPVTGDEAGTPLEECMAQAAGRLLSRLGTADASVFTALPGDAVSVHRLSLPSNIGRRADQVIHYELDEQLPFDIEDAVFHAIPQVKKGDEMQWLAMVARVDRIRPQLDALAQEEIEPRSISVAHWMLGEFFDKEVTAPTLIIDIGHVRTTMAVVGDSQRTGRTFLRGGKSFTAYLAQEGNIALADAEVLKHRDGMTGRVGEILQGAMQPLVREIQQTLAGYAAAGGQPVTSAILCGGSSQMPGLALFLSQALSMSVEVYNAPTAFEKLGVNHGEMRAQEFVLALSLARSEEIHRSRRFNLRRGEFAFKGDSEALQRKLIWALVAVLLLLGAWVFSAVTRYMTVEHDVAAIEAQVRAETKRVLGEELVNAETIAARLNPSVDTRMPVPTKDAYDILVELSHRIPESVAHDLDLLDIKPRKIKMRGEVNNTVVSDAGDTDGDDDLSPTDFIKQRLAEYSECFVTFRIPRVQNVGNRQKYDMEIDSRCP